MGCRGRPRKLGLGPVYDALKGPSAGSIVVVWSIELESPKVRHLVASERGRWEREFTTQVNTMSVLPKSFKFLERGERLCREFA
jgi:hypothetical protein